MIRQRERRDSREHESNWKSSRDRGRGRGRGRGRSSPPPAKAPFRYRERNTDTENGGPGKAERQFTNRCKLFIGNLPNGTTEKDITELFSPFGKTNDAFIASGRNFGFIKLDTRQNTEIAKLQLDGTVYKGRTVRVRFAASNATVTVSNLHPMVSNEYLEEAFKMFGEVERAVVLTDERSKSIGKGFVEFVRRSSAQNAVHRCKEGNFLLTRSPIPVIVQPMSAEQDEDGVSERSIRNDSLYAKERDGFRPRFTHPASVEGEIASRFKALSEVEQQQRELLDKQMKEAKEKLEAEVENLLHEHQAKIMRQDLMQQEEDLRRYDSMRRYEERMLADIERENEEFEYGHHRPHDHSDIEMSVFRGEIFPKEESGRGSSTARLLMQAQAAMHKREGFAEDFPGRSHQVSPVVC